MSAHRFTENRITQNTKPMEHTHPLSPEILCRMVTYDPESGAFVWLERSPELSCARLKKSCDIRLIGKPAFNSPDEKGYLKGRILGKCYRAHRVAYAMFHGKWPDGQIDHINGDRSDNRISNLRDVSPLENSRNVKRKADNTSGVQGVCWSGLHKQWRARASDRGRRIEIGLFHSLDDAAAARAKALRELGYHPNHGRSGS